MPLEPEATRPRRLRTVFCTRGGLFGALVLRRLRACDRIEICAIVRSSRTYHPAFGFMRGALAYCARSGIRYALYLFCATTLADAACGLGRLGCVPVRTNKTGVRVLTTRDINDARGVEFLRSCAPDLIVSAFFDQRLAAAALAVPCVGAINIHPSLLPEFKGVDPVLQATLHRSEPMGVSVHYMVPALDAGDIIAAQAVDLPPGASVFAKTAVLFSRGADLLAGVIERIGRGEAGRPQSTGGSYQSWPSRAEIRVLRTLRSRLIRPSDLTHILLSRMDCRG
jgi:methionyl-tRNA formyltransferase